MTGPAPAAAPALSRPVTQDSLRRFLAGLDPRVDWQTLDGDQPLRKAGLDSLDFFNLVMALEAATGLAIPDEDLERLGTLDRLEAYLNGR